MVIESNELNLLWLQDGEDGTPGTPGKDGQVLYTWMKYSHNADGSNMSDDSTNMVYVGIAYNKTSKTESTNPSDYAWSKIKGEPGSPGTDAYTIILENENISFATSSLKVPLNNQTATCKITVLQGAKPRTDYIIGTITSPTGITVKESSKVITLSVNTNTAIENLSGAIDIPIQIDGISFTKQITYSLAVKGETGDSPVSVYLSNENHTFAATKDGHAFNAQIQTNVYAYYGSTQVSATVGDITSPLGMTIEILNNGKSNTILAISVTSDLNENGVLDIPITVGSNEYHCTFSYTLSRQGADGSPAKSIDITSSSQIFKSTDGGVTFAPDIITLTPRLQGGITYSKWQCSVNGGKTWNDITSTTNGISITSGVLSISKSSTLYTKTITSIVFKCLSSDSSFYDTCTISKLYDVVDIRNDIEAEFTQVKSSISGVEQKADKANKSITDKVWQTDITDTLNNYDKTTIKDVRDRTTAVEKNLEGITSTVQDMQTTVSNKADGSTVTELTNRVAKAEQNAEGFKQTVESTYAKQTDLDNVNKYAKTSFEQLSDKFTWIVTSTSNSTSLTLTDSVISAITKQFVIKDSSGKSTIIEGGKIKTDALKSNNYIAGTYVDGAGYSSLGTFIDLENGMIHTPGFYTDTIGNAYFNGTINALDGWFGTEQHNWYIGTTIITDIMNNDGALTGDEYSYLKATENAAIVVNEWHLQSQNDNMSLQSGLTTLNNGKFVLNSQDNKYYDFGIVKPDMSKDAKSYNKKFLYIRRADTPTTHPQDWEYLFHVDYDGSIWYKNQNVAGGNVFLSTTGGTIKGDLTVTGTLNATANQAKKVVNALSINGKAYDGSAAINVGSISIAYGGTGGTTVNEARANLGVLGANNKNGYYGLARPDGNDIDWIRSTVNGLIPYQSGNAGDGHSSLGTSTWYFSEAYIDFIHGSLKGTADRAICDDEGNKISSTYLKATSTEFDSITVGNMIVNGTARFVNGLMGTLTGNVIGNVSGSAGYATSSDTANYINLVATNEIRFYKNQFKGGTVHFGYRWADGSTSPLITEYRFNNGNGSPTQVTASQFNGNLNGIATKTTLLNPVTTSDTFTTGTSTWRMGITDGYVVWGQWWKDTSLTNDTGDLTIWIRKEGDVTTANMTIDGTIYAVGGFNGNATSATKLQTARKIGNASFDGTADISLSSIGAASSGHTHNYASTLSLNGTNFTVASNKITVSREQLLTAIGASSGSVNGYMSAADKSKLDSITVSDIGTVGANSIKGTGYIKATIAKGVATLSHNTSGVTAGTYGADSTNYLTIPKIVVDSTGHITSARAYSVTAANLVSKLGTTAVNRATADSDGNAINSTYLKRSGGTMNGTSMITWADSGNWGISNKDVTFPVKRGGLKWNGQSDGVELFAEETGSDNLDLVIKFTDDNSNGLSIRNNADTQTARISATGVFTGSFSGNASSASKLQTARTIFGKSFDGTANVAGQATVYGSYNTTATSRYTTSGIQVCENSLVGSAQSDIAYAPSIGFRWSNRTAATLLYHSDGNFYFRKQNFTDRATIDANLIAASVSSTNISASGTLGVIGTATFTAMSIHNGGIKSSLLQLQGSTVASIDYGSSNPKIRFVDSNGSQIVDLMYNDYDSVRKPAGLAMRGNQGGEYFDVPHLYASQVHVDNHCALQYDSSNQCLNFVFS